MLSKKNHASLEIHSTFLTLKFPLGSADIMAWYENSLRNHLNYLLYHVRIFQDVASILELIH